MKDKSGSVCRKRVAASARASKEVDAAESSALLLMPLATLVSGGPGCDPEPAVGPGED